MVVGNFTDRKMEEDAGLQMPVVGWPLKSKGVQ